MSRLAQLGVFSIALGGIVLALGFFPSAVDADSVGGIGLLQIVAILAGMVLLVLGAYITAHAMLKRGQEHTLLNRVGIRLGLTGMVFAAAATLADAMGFGSHTSSSGPLFGWLQAVGLLTGFLIAAVGVLLYGASR